jgi:hypothetical protein
VDSVDARADRRLEPLGESFRLDAAAARRSALHARTVFVAVPDRGIATDLVAGLGLERSVTLTPQPSRLFAGGVDPAWAAFRIPSDVGLATLLRPGEYLALLRQLVDDILAPAAAGADLLLDWCPEHATPLAIEVIASVCPDAAIVTSRDLAEQLPEQLAAHVVVASGDVAADARHVLSTLDHPRSEASGGASSAHSVAAPLQPDRLLVVVGCGRSGTTWFEELWFADPRIGGVPRGETWIFHQLRHLWRAFERGDGFASWLPRTDFVRALRRYCDGVFGVGLAHHRAGADYFVEKSPVHAEHLPEIAAVYPDAWVMHLLRDGRDVARSISQVPFFGVPDVGAAAGMWQRVVDSIRRDQSQVRRLRDVRYEDLHADPVRVMTALCEWIGMTAGADVEAGWRSGATRRVSTHAGTAASVGPGTWRSLPPSDQAAIYRACGRRLVQEGYLSRSGLARARLAATARALSRTG